MFGRNFFFRFPFFGNAAVLWFFLLTLSYVPVYAQEVSEQEAPDQKIVGGQEVNPPGKYPWQVALVKKGASNLYDGQFCGGSLISPRWVLTAAHCLGTETEVIAGVHNLSTGSGYQRRTVVRSIGHESYNNYTKDNDIAILALASPITLGGSGATRADVVALVPGSMGSLAGESSVASGWGALDPYFTKYPPALQEVTRPLLSNSVCDDPNHYGGKITENMICSGSIGMGTCKGDSGGPLVINKYGSYMLAGATSWGQVPCTTLPGVFVRVANYLDWIARWADRPLYRFYNKSTDVYFYTIREEEKVKILQDLPQYTLQGPMFYAYLTPQDGTSPVYRFFNTQTYVHFYTISESEREYIKKTWPWFREEGIAFYAFTLQKEGTVPVYRFFNTKTATHFFTTSETEKAEFMNKAGYQYDGIVFYAF